MPKAKKAELNRPKEGTDCAKIWAICDKYKGNRQAVLKECEKKGFNKATAVTQYSRWRVFTGYVRPKAEKAVKTTKKPAKKGPPKKSSAPKSKPAAEAPAAESAPAEAGA